jgi:hypothetical protein
MQLIEETLIRGLLILMAVALAISFYVLYEKRKPWKDEFVHSAHEIFEENKINATLLNNLLKRNTLLVLFFFTAGTDEKPVKELTNTLNGSITVIFIHADTRRNLVRHFGVKTTPEFILYSPKCKFNKKTANLTLESRELKNKCNETICGRRITSPEYARKDPTMIFVKELLSYVSCCSDCETWWQG